MAALDFPSSPSVGQTYPNPAVAGQPVYTWDGEKWTAGGTTGNIYISDAAPAAPVGSLWWESDTGILYVRYNDGTSTQWVAIAGSNANAVVYDTVQALTEAQKATARSNIYAAPFDALAYSGMQINGSMEVSQERAFETVIPNGFMCDGWSAYNGATPAAFNCVAGAIGGAGFGTTKHIAVSTATAKPSLAAGDLALVYHPIEGYRAVRLAFGTAQASPFTIAFRTCHRAVGTYTICIQNSAYNRSYVATYTQNVSEIWEYKTITIPGDVAGTWAYDNTVGIVVSFILAAGSNFVAPTLNTWLAGDYRSAAGQVQLTSSTTTNYFRLTGVVVLPGIEAPSAARSPLIMRPYDQELLTCQRYWQTALVGFQGYSPGSVYNSVTYSFPTGMRASPTMALQSQIALSNLGIPFFENASVVGFRITALSSTAGNINLNYYVTADARL